MLKRPKTRRLICPSPHHNTEKLPDRLIIGKYVYPKCLALTRRLPGSRQIAGFGRNRDPVPPQPEPTTPVLPGQSV
jgi:hypothetical protein